MIGAMLRLSCIVIVACLVACGDDGDGKPVDASDTTADGSPAGSDGGPTDGPSSAIDAPMTTAVGPACGATTCSNTTEDCCIGQAEVCKPTGTCPSQGFACDGPEDCASGRCCYGNGGTGGSECSTATNCQVACHADMNCPTATPKCCPKTFTPTGYGVCQTQC